MTAGDLEDFPVWRASLSKSAFRFHRTFQYASSEASIFPRIASKHESLWDVGQENRVW